MTDIRDVKMKKKSDVEQTEITAIEMHSKIRNAYAPPPSKFRKKLRNNIGLLFILLWLIGFLAFKLYPFMSSLYYSFTDFNLFKGITEYGFDNYEKIFTSTKTLTSLSVTFKYAFITVPLKLAAALFIAYILNFKLKGVNLFRTAYYIPSILGGSVAIAVLWKAVFRDDGLINSALEIIGIDGPKWLSDPSYALLVISLLRVWQFGSAMVIFLAALRSVPEEMYEAATIDGAGKWKQFCGITVPLITPVIFYNLITQLCQAFQEFNGPYIITQGGPRNSTTLMSLLIYNSAFKQYEMGMASAMAWVLFVILMGFTVIAFISQKYWVYYSDEGK
jgi:oligogalacturonide transport system permease protein